MNSFRFPLVASFVLGMALWPRVTSAVLIPAPHDSTVSSPSVNVLNSISIPNNGGPLGSRVYFSTFNLTNSDLIVESSTEAAALSDYANVTDMVRSGYDAPNDDWAGTGITSSTAAADAAGNGTTSLGFPSSGITAVGVILNDDGSQVHGDGSGNPIWNTWDGIAVNQYAVLVKYTFFGDTNLKGKVGATDVNVVASNFGTGTGWAHGEFNYTGGTVNTRDVQQVNNSLSLESEYGVTPEPSTLLLAVLAVLGAVSTQFVRHHFRCQPV
jgi:hypothetical protein